MSAAELSEIELHGKQIYLSGTTPNGSPITAILGIDQIELPASAAPCGSCHGIDGRGRPEGGVLPSDITWSELSKGYGHEHAFDRRHPAFDDESLAVSIIGGVDPGGNKLDVAMPRYRMEQLDIDALVAYLKRIENDLDAGVSEHVVRIATLLPLSGPAASQGDAVRIVLAAFVEQLNAGGGVNGRTIDLEVIPLGATPAQTVINLQDAQDAQDSSGLFALVASYVPDVDTELAASFSKLEIPVVGSMAPTPDANRNRLPNTYYLYAGKLELLQALAHFALGNDGDEQRRQVIVGPESRLLHEFSAVLPATENSPVEVIPHSKSGFSLPVTAGLLNESDDVFFLGTAAELDELLSALGESGNIPRLFLPAAIATPRLLNTPNEFNRRIFVAYPTMPGDVDDNGRRSFARLAESAALPAAHIATQVSALAAVRILVEAMQRSGYALNRERLLEELESMNGYETGLTPPISFNLNRRIGALGAHIVMVDHNAGRLIPVTAWTSLP